MLSKLYRKNSEGNFLLLFLSCIAYISLNLCYITSAAFLYNFQATCMIMFSPYSLLYKPNCGTVSLNNKWFYINVLCELAKFWIGDNRKHIQLRMALHFLNFKYLLCQWTSEAPSWQQKKLSGRQHMEEVASKGLELTMPPFSWAWMRSSA